MPPIYRFSLFWRFWLYLWLTLALVVTLTFALARGINQNSLVKNWHPDLKGVPLKFFKLYEKSPEKAFEFLLEKRKRYIFVQILDEKGNVLVSNFKQENQAEIPNKKHKWRQFNQEFEYQNENFLFIYRIPNKEINSWQRHNFIWLWAGAAILVSLVILTIISFVLTFSITSPLYRLRLAVQDLAHNNYQPQNLTKLLKRNDEFGLLAQDFNAMGFDLQNLIRTMRRLLRDVSHELRSPLARLKIASALLFQSEPNNRQKLQQQIELECSRLDSLIDEILTLARLEEPQKTPFKECNLLELLQNLIFATNLTHPKQKIELTCPPISLNTDASLLERALNNLITNAIKFNAANMPIIITAVKTCAKIVISVRDFGGGVKNENLAKLGSPFWRGNPQIKGNGLGLAIARRAITNLGGSLTFANHTEGGFIAQIELLT